MWPGGWSFTTSYNPEKAKAVIARRWETRRPTGQREMAVSGKPARIILLIRTEDQRRR
jgi:hypothetical protein